MASELSPFEFETRRSAIKDTALSQPISLLSRMSPGVGLVCCVALVRSVIYLVAAPNYGYFRDEMYYLACGQHPAWGYMDQPPLIAWMAWLLEHTIGVVAVCAPASADAGRCGLHRDDRAVGPQARRWPLGDVSGFSCCAGRADLSDVVAFVHNECFRSAFVDLDCLVSCPSRPNRQRKELDMDRSFDRRYAAQQVRRAVSCSLGFLLELSFHRYDGALFGPGSGQALQLQR